MGTGRLTTIKVGIGHSGRSAIDHTHVILKVVATATRQSIEASHHTTAATGWVAG